MSGEAGEPTVEALERCREHDACSQHCRQRHVVVGIDVAPVHGGRAVTVAGREAKPSTAALGQRKTNPTDARSRKQVREGMRSELIDAVRLCGCHLLHTAQRSPQVGYTPFL